MSVSYKKLWKLLIDKDMKKKDLCEKAGISPASVTKMGRNGHVTTEILVKICAALDCRIEDIVEIVPDNALIFYVGTSRARIKLEIAAILSDDDCKEILMSILNYRGKIRRAQKDLAGALNAIGSLDS